MTTSAEADQPIRAITVRQPWALATAVGAKTVENRGRPTSHRGLLAIHAGTTPDTDGDRDPRVTKLLGPDPRLGAPVGKVVAVANLVDCHQAAGGCCQPWGEPVYRGGPAFHLVLASVLALPQPVPCRGQIQVPWLLPGPVAELVRAQIAGWSAGCAAVAAHADAIGALVDGHGDPDREDGWTDGCHAVASTARRLAHTPEATS